MSWNGTVRCSNCYERGHNRSGCPSLKENMQRRLEADPEDWRARQYFDAKKRRSTRSCSYCSFAGHNRATCKELDFAKAMTANKARLWREKAQRFFEINGLGVGTLVRYDSYNREKVGMISSIDWSVLDHRLSGSPYHEPRAISVVNIENFAKIGAGHDCVTPVPPLHGPDSEGVLHPDYSPYFQLVIVSALTPEAVQKQISGSWLTGNDCATAIFTSDTKARDVSEWVELQGFYKESQAS